MNYKGKGDRDASTALTDFGVRSQKKKEKKRDFDNFNCTCICTVR